MIIELAQSLLLAARVAGGRRSRSAAEIDTLGHRQGRGAMFDPTAMTAEPMGGLTRAGEGSARLELEEAGVMRDARAPRRLEGILESRGGDWMGP
jgi:hypothetical protein